MNQRITIQSFQVKPRSFRLLSPFVTAAGEKSITQNVQVVVLLSNGLKGYGEASTSIALVKETAAAMEQTIRTLAPDLRGQPIENYKDLIQLCWQRQPYHPTAISAIECAVLDAWSRCQGIGLHQFFGGKKTDVETDLTLSIAEPAALVKMTTTASRKGFRRFKVKLGADGVEKNLERLRAVHKTAPRALLVADGNQGLNRSQAVQLMRGLERERITLQFLEQPFPKHDLQAMRQFRKVCNVPLWADESAMTLADANRLLEQDAVDGINIKIAKSGVLGALDIIHRVQQAKKKLGLGCMEESKMGLAFSVHLACGTGVFDWIDLDSIFLLEKSTLRGGFRANGPKLSVAGIQSGLGIA